MLTYADKTTNERMSDVRCIDVLDNVQTDVLGVAQCLGSLSVMARETAIDPAPLALLADVLFFAADALGDIVNGKDVTALDAETMQDGQLDEPDE